MDELAALQAQLAGVQSASSGYTLSDRNVIQLVLKLVDKGNVEVRGFMCSSIALMFALRCCS